MQGVGGEAAGLEGVREQGWVCRDPVIWLDVQPLGLGGGGWGGRESVKPH